jgi:hypothetical protein
VEAEVEDFPVAAEEVEVIRVAAVEEGVPAEEGARAASLFLETWRRPLS